MTAPVYHHQPEYALITTEKEKADQLRRYVGATVHYFPDAASFLVFLITTMNASEYLKLILAAQYVSNLPPDIEQRVHELLPYVENGNDDTCHTFDEVCLYLGTLAVAQLTLSSISFRLSNNNGLARDNRNQSLLLNKLLIQKLQEICDDLDEQTSIGQAETNQ